MPVVTSRGPVDTAAGWPRGTIHREGLWRICCWCIVIRCYRDNLWHAKEGSATIYSVLFYSISKYWIEAMVEIQMRLGFLLPSRFQSDHKRIWCYLCRWWPNVCNSGQYRILPPEYSLSQQQHQIHIQSLSSLWSCRVWWIWCCWSWQHRLRYEDLIIMALRSVLVLLHLRQLFDEKLLYERHLIVLVPTLVILTVRES